MTSDEAHEVAGEYGLELRFDTQGKSWSLGPAGVRGRDKRVWIAAQTLRNISRSHFVGHYVKEALRRDGQDDEDDQD